MSERKTKTYCENGNLYSFDFDSFDLFFGKYCQKKKLKKETAEIEIGKKLNVSEHAVHSWRFRSFAPADITIARNLATILGAENQSIFLKRIKEGNRMENLNERQIIAVKKIYDCIVDVLFELKNNYKDFEEEYYEQVDANRSEVDDDEQTEYADDIDDMLGYVFERIRIETDRVRNAIAKEYFDLHDTEIYDQFSSFCENELTIAFFSCDPNSSTEDFCAAIKKLHIIIGAEGDTSIFVAPNQYRGHSGETEDEAENDTDSTQE